tara:strand:+ start:1674 stop:2396 length:723 start_codon:yes stop_codon:yes gene_type:complete
MDPLELLLLVVLPPVLYVLIIYWTSPFKSINLKTAVRYLIGGVISISFHKIITVGFPYEPQFLFMKPGMDFWFLEVAPKEEIAKFLAFLGIWYISKKDEDNHPIGNMFYCGMVGLGFAMIENISYLQKYGHETLIIRQVTSTLSHMIFGMLAGYWFALGQIRSAKFSRSIFNMFTNRYPRFKTFIYSVMGVSCGILYHGLWNYNLMASSSAAYSIMILMLFGGLVGCKFAADSLNIRWKK